MRPVRYASLGTTLQNRAQGPFNVQNVVGSGSAQTVVTGVDLQHNTGLVWLKDRTAANNHVLVDTLRGVQKDLYTNSTAIEATESSVTAFNNNGFTLGTLAAINTNGNNVVAWTFVERYNFFKIESWTGNGAAGRVINHGLGAPPGMVIVKSRSAIGSWAVYHASATGDLIMDTTAAQAGSRSDVTAVTANTITVGSGANVNASGVTYVAYFFGSAIGNDEHMKCGSYAGSGATGTTVTLGWEPQLVLVKNLTTAGNWSIADNLRGLSITQPEALLRPNTNNADTALDCLAPSPTGFTTIGTSADTNAIGSTYAYMAIRVPTVFPTAATDVLDMFTRTGNAAAATIAAALTPDLTIIKSRSNATSWIFTDRLRGVTTQVSSDLTSAESVVAANVTNYGLTNAYVIGTGGSVNTLLATYVNYALKRWPGVFDIASYTGNGVSSNITHNLRVPPELILVKSRSAVGAWSVFASLIGNTNKLILNTTAIPVADTTAWNSSSPNSATFPIGTQAALNTANATYIAFLFATFPGISKIGTYTGNGSSLTVNCGFSTGARLILIKRIDVTGNWQLWDTARGIVTGNDPYLAMNINNAEVSGNDSVDPAAVGIIVNQLAASNINVTGATYLFLALA